MGKRLEQVEIVVEHNDENIFLFFVAVACFCYSAATITRVHVCPCRPVPPCSAVLSRTLIAVRLWSRCGACDAHPLARITLLRRLRARSGNRRWLLLFLLCRFLLSPSSLEALLPFLILAFPDHVVKGPIDIDGIFDFVLWECEKFHGERVVCLTRVCSWRIGWLVGRLAGVWDIKGTMAALNEWELEGESRVQRIVNCIVQ